MRRSSSHPRHSVRATLLALGAFLGSDCVGTPLPEPPDELPRPEFSAIEHTPFADTAAGGPPVVREAQTIIQSRNGGVAPGARVWAINLDKPGSAAVETTADALGGFTLELLAGDQQRVRVIARTERQHSAPLDLLVSVSKSGNPPVSAVGELRNTGLACLQLTPPETLVLTGKQGSLLLINQCDMPVQITRAELRLGDQGIALATTPPEEVLPGAPLTLTLTDSQGPAKRERLDILLLDVSTPAGLTGSYAVDVFSDLK